MKEFKKCPNGHYYQGTNCPYCPANATAGNNETETMGGNNADKRTEIYGMNKNAGTETTQDGNKTKVMEGFGNVNDSTVSDNSSNAGGNINNQNISSNRTVFGDDVEIETPTGSVKVEQQYRNTRKLVGWLVTYSADKMGIDFKLYEGRNIIGRDADCNITVHDRMVSGKHAILLFRADRYSLTDSQSSHGTFVNSEDIALEPHYLNDGDIICMGETVFKFRSSL
ncbi:MAG: FHA domain-containing protein [Prevotellaceae bacterium]|jgi:hypothetical protein|nr:FHA domain-containing protein [Prevotellaceae bacterium]